MEVPERLGDERKLQKILRREWPGRQKGNQGAGVRDAKLWKCFKETVMACVTLY